MLDQAGGLLFFTRVISSSHAARLILTAGRWYVLDVRIWCRDVGMILQRV